MSAHSPRSLQPPLYFILSGIAMVALNRWLPVVRWLEHPGDRVGYAIMAVGFVLAVVIRAMFRRVKTTIVPFERSAALITTWPFSMSRNPIYLSLVIIQIGVAVRLGSISPVVVIPLFVWLVTTRVIAHEERILQDTFGEAYEDYRARVRRWL